jgi:hypothetical protein
VRGSNGEIVAGRASDFYPEVRGIAFAPVSLICRPAPAGEGHFLQRARPKQRLTDEPPMLTLLYDAVLFSSGGRPDNPPRA